ncbi:ead/Ea22-like family protein [Citrobacter sp. RHB35-C21]|uniref:ead/Ea22-like family protein n=1 Tax=Citrobacter sp. RHB35-C21 TaxID=2742626 RepID=UPI0015E9CA73|nr:ead/Ea22-like family protein [Citrobacter sp. RHB35-C21]QMD51664.1 ead/Ea22-like family protein [Citrobacter sp. RHB35-C21]
MTALNKQALRSKARSASAGEWIKESGDGWEAICSSDDQANGNFIIAHFEGPDAKANREFSQAANPDTVLALLDELEAANELVELQRFKLERQAEDLHQAKSLESIHRDKRLEVEREFRGYKDRAESNSMRLAKEVCRLEDELQAAGIGVKGE